MQQSSKLKNNLGFSLVEVILALAIFALFWSAIVTLSTGSFSMVEQGGKHTEASVLSREGVEAVRSISDSAWNELIFSTSTIEIWGNEWIFSGEGSTSTIDSFIRNISFNDVCRDSNDDVVDCPGLYVDPHSKEVLSEISWTVRNGLINSVLNRTILSNWDSNDWIQTDWVGGSGQTQWSNIDEYLSDDSNVDITDIGSLSLLDGGLVDGAFENTTGPSTYDWDFASSTEYTFDNAKIEVDSGYGQLLYVGGGPLASGSTTNSDFASAATPWTYGDWEDASRVNGTYQSSGGNPSGHVDITIDERKSTTISGYWQQSFTTTVDNPDATVDLDWIIKQYDPSFITSFTLYVFVTSSAGAPTVGQQVWSQSITGTTSWNSASAIDVSSAIGTAGTYYVKVAARVITTGGGGAQNGNNIIGFDNIILNWQESGGGGGSYPTDIPTIYPNTNFTVSGNGNWDSFTETALKNGGEIYYQLSDDGGSTWQYWNGSSWVSAGSSNYNTATTVDSNIASFSTASSQISFKAFLESDGTQFVRLSNININFVPEDSPWDFSVWDIDPGETSPVGSTLSSGGNPDEYVDITFANGSNKETGGYWEQQFITYKNTPSTATLDFDYIVVDYNGIPQDAEIRIYVDTSTGDPVNQVGASINLSAETSWISASQYDLSSDIATAGTYYLKIAGWVDTGTGGGSGPFTIGFDNIDLDIGDARYPILGELTSSQFDTGTSSKIQIIEWDENVSSCVVDCDIQFQVRSAPDSGGSPGAWTSWYGENGSGDYFATSTGSLISTDLNDNQWIQYRLDLIGPGTSTPILEEVRVNYK